LSLTTTYDLRERWSVAVQGGSRLLGDFADSPVVNCAGSADQWSGAVGVGIVLKAII
jgi:outer membrane scaffolding protein for murein synthesis (MipA/OmpV family)